jgi:CBS domain-containing protein
MKVRDVMTASVVSVRPEDTVQEAARALRDNRISAVPVLDQEGRLLGIVSEGDLMRRTEIGTERPASWWLRLFGDTTGLAAEYARTHGLTARDVMTAPAIHVDEDAGLAEVAALLETHRIKRVPVVRDGRVVGIVSRANLVQALASARPAMAAPSETDAAIRERLIVKLQEQPWAALHEMNIVVQDGTVHLWGFVRSETERSAVRIAAERTAGVRAIEDHLLIKPLVMWE